MWIRFRGTEMSTFFCDDEDGRIGGNGFVFSCIPSQAFTLSEQKLKEIIFRGQQNE
jgi:hypothetical protein